MSEHKLVNGTVLPLDADDIAALAAARQADAALAAVAIWRSLRAERDARLAACDWVELAHLAGRMIDAEWTAWAAYRQDLRDLPANTADPERPAWPLRPD